MDNICSIEELYKKYYREIVNWAASMTGDYSEAEDLVQEAFLNVIDHEELLSQLPEMQARAWVY